ncbi:MAG: sensor domain-containing diguanylate cyclase [Isosphaeraceae bacterium]
MEMNNHGRAAGESPDTSADSPPAPPAAPSPPDGLPLGPGFFETLFDNLYDGIYFVDRGRRILHWNKSAERISGYSKGEVVGRSCHHRVLDHADAEGRSLCLGQCPLAQSMRTGLPESARVYMRHKDGRRIAVDVHIVPIRDSQDQVVGGVEVFRDASSMVALESAYSKMQELSERDPLTGAANRRYLDAILAQQFELLRRAGIPFAVVMADLDHFKRVNDTWGHPAGDRALIGFVRALEQSCRPTDVVGRYGGEEFLAILPNTQLEQARTIAERMRLAAAEVATPEIGGHRVTSSFGAAEAGPDETFDALLRRADTALYDAKRLGRNRVACSDSPADGHGTPA